jgi:hypothetical protein
MHRKSWMTLGLVGVLGAALAGCAAQQAAPPKPVALAAVEEKPGQVVEESVVSAVARVVKVNQKTRTVTLKNSEGEVFDVEVGAEVRNLPQVKAGDDVVVTYYESMAITLKKPGEAKPGVETADTAGRAKPGEKPGAVAGTQTTVTATVVGINKKKGTVTLKGPNGKVVKVQAREPKRLEPVQVGDLIEVAYTQALAISVEKPAKK